ncbi:hypothetical protein F4779DRAFT_591383 [Xylariaceae sp. FL0662B]|nr:hypothetical protein F4779DRAFT_591383 [Xylariaceae sp. FL0662B]
MYRYCGSPGFHVVGPLLFAFLGTTWLPRLSAGYLLMQGSLEWIASGVGSARICQHELSKGELIRAITALLFVAMATIFNIHHHR